MFLYLHKVGLKVCNLLKVSSNNLQLNSFGIQNNNLNSNYAEFNDSFVKNPNNVKPRIMGQTSPFNANVLPSKLLLSAYLDPKIINKFVKSNPQIKNILSEHGLEYKIYPQNIRDIINTHLSTTTNYALQIADYMNISPNERKILEQACVFHDYGKLLIPEEIISKKGSLNKKEREIVDLHSELGYQLLLLSGINQRTLDLIRNHHKPYKESADKLQNILSVADIYSALREERSYKKPMTVGESLEILDQKAIEGEVSPEVLNALKKSLINAYAA